MLKEQWVWMPHPAHLCVAHYCQFRLGGYVVSTVGEYIPPAGMQEFIAQQKGVVLEGTGSDRRADYLEKIGFEEIGAGRKYETMVFRADPQDDPDCACACCLWRCVGGEVDTRRYNDPVAATKGHMAACEDWSGG